MKEGWHSKDYLVLFAEEEVAAVTASYGVSQYLPNHVVVGIYGWDHFIVRDSDGRLFTVPTVPLLREELSPLDPKAIQGDLQADERFRTKIKWYIKPIVFGGDPNPGQNMTWISINEHQEAVKWWNQLYSDVKSKVTQR